MLRHRSSTHVMCRVVRHQRRNNIHLRVNRNPRRNACGMFNFCEETSNASWIFFVGHRPTMTAQSLPMNRVNRHRTHRIMCAIHSRYSPIRRTLTVNYHYHLHRRQRRRQTWIVTGNPTCSSNISISRVHLDPGHHDPTIHPPVRSHKVVRSRQRRRVQQPILSNTSPHRIINWSTHVIRTT